MTLHGRKDATPNLATYVHNIELMASSSHGFEDMPALARQKPQSHQAPQMGSQTTKKRKRHDDDDNFWGLIALILGTLCACAGLAGFLIHDSMKTPPRWPTVSAISDITTSHNDWLKVHDTDSQRKNIPKIIKSCETSMTHMRATIKHSDMHNRQRLQQGMQAFSFETDEVVSKFIAWNSFAQATVDETQNLNDHVLKTTAPVNDVGGFRGRWTQVRGLLSQEGRRIGAPLQYLKEERTHLLNNLDTVGVHLQTIAELLRDEEASLDSQDKDSTERRTALKGMLEMVTKTHRVINHVQVTVKTSGRGLERLRQVVWGIENNSGYASEDIPLCLSNIQAAVDRLGDMWKPNKCGSK
ncbi:uncharacterized protein NECHADRAFT_87432 [Fusarium vanettenii 77-13-4]|uniref:Uncharacterized protein n=1 Tax=Fusarium vanettenii (strain ATCC MYA-4622 / CBS 123669 / FGSC 9596 / NRRL 45880 / 77-13-4) TaxID=660122 RepID=C7ZEF2_FUSV7|nr:uncharacterized protein NECHADRAFT_87432 [Fusarium vanettenii 77-13-4]EEU37665.1 predicted protein [Fusarium vanettenii 77-13-4]